MTRYRGGDIRYGLRLVDGRIVDDPDEQSVIARIRFLAGLGMSLRIIANRLGNTTRAGTPWHPQSVKRVLRHAARTPNDPLAAE